MRGIQTKWWSVFLPRAILANTVARALVAKDGPWPGIGVPPNEPLPSATCRMTFTIAGLNTTYEVFTDKGKIKARLCEEMRPLP